MQDPSAKVQDAIRMVESVYGKGVLLTNNVIIVEGNTCRASVRKDAILMTRSAVSQHTSGELSFVLSNLIKESRRSLPGN